MMNDHLEVCVTQVLVHGAVHERGRHADVLEQRVDQLRVVARGCEDDGQLVGRDDVSN
jgi:hypothetical protein